MRFDDDELSKFSLVVLFKANICWNLIFSSGPSVFFFWIKLRVIPYQTGYGWSGPCMHTGACRWSCMLYSFQGLGSWRFQNNLQEEQLTCTNIHKCCLTNFKSYNFFSMAIITFSFIFCYFVDLFISILMTQCISPNIHIAAPFLSLTIIYNRNMLNCKKQKPIKNA